MFSFAAGLMPPSPNVAIQRFDPQGDTAVSGEGLLRHSLAADHHPMFQSRDLTLKLIQLSQVKIRLIYFTSKSCAFIYNLLEDFRD